MRVFRTLRPLKHNNKCYKINDEVILNEAEAVPLVSHGVILLLREEEAYAAESSAGEPAVEPAPEPGTVLKKGKGK